MYVQYTLYRAVMFRILKLRLYNPSLVVFWYNWLTPIWSSYAIKNAVRTSCQIFNGRLGDRMTLSSLTIDVVDKHIKRLVQWCSSL